MSESYEVKFKYFSFYEDENENYATFVVEDFDVRSLDELLGILGISDDENLFDMDFDDSEGINFDAKSEMIESGREVIWIKDNNGTVINTY